MHIVTLIQPFFQIYTIGFLQEVKTDIYFIQNLVCNKCQVTITNLKPITKLNQSKIFSSYPFFEWHSMLFKLNLFFLKAAKSSAKVPLRILLQTSKDVAIIKGIM